MPISKELYRERKNNNLCTKCEKNAEPNKTLCTYHLHKANKSQQAMFARRRNKGLCHKCGTKLINNRKTCNNCLEKSAPNHGRDDVRIPWTDRKKLGLCVACGKQNSTSNQWCNQCSKKYRTTESLTRRQRIENGLCGDCGKRLLAVKSNTRCIICIYKQKKWYAESDFRQRRIQKDRLLRKRVIQHYGGECACCGETERTFLAIDHINGDGNIHRKKIKRLGSSFDKWLINNNFPKEFQILCYNCNMSKYLNGGICAHQHKNSDVSTFNGV